MYKTGEYNLIELTDKEFRVLSGFIEKQYGIRMPQSKQVMLQSRLQKRIAELDFSSFKQYMDFLFSTDGRASEQDHFATIVSTHKTEFFRENTHFIALRDVLLPEILKNEFNQTLTVWSAASSTGEEVYSIAITIYDYFKMHGNLYPQLKVFGTDISDDIVEFARKGIYSNKSISTIPLQYRSYIMRSKDPRRHAIRIVPEIRRYTEFFSQNLIAPHYNIPIGIHIIFCRNVLIYFERQLQEEILRRLTSLLAPGGFLIIGHSETLSGIDLPLEQVQMTIYRKVRKIK